MNPKTGNPIIQGWYADPEARIFDTTYWIYPTYSAAYESQTFFDAFSSQDLRTWTKHPRILEFGGIPWSTNRAAWAPSVIRRPASPTFPHTDDAAAQGEKNGHGYDYFMYFSAGDGAGIGVAKSTTGRPEGPYADALGKPLIPSTVFGAEPIDAQVFIDDDDDDDDDCISGGGAMPSWWSWGVTWGESPTGPFSTEPVKILSGNATVGTGTGHNSVITPDGKDYYIVYHRRPVNDTERDHRVVCIDRMEFGAEGNILPVMITTEGVDARALDQPKPV
ncbi:hypothetical protein KXW97_006480 [Aspergillus fumigatus]|nr:hypothetical protein KXW97_006480 [Aspergillus fumigatus]